MGLKGLPQAFEGGQSATPRPADPAVHQQQYGHLRIATPGEDVAQAFFQEPGPRGLEAGVAQPVLVDLLAGSVASILEPVVAGAGQRQARDQRQLSRDPAGQVRASLPGGSGLPFQPSLSPARDAAATGPGDDALQAPSRADLAHGKQFSWLRVGANQVAKSMTCNQHGLPLFDSIRLC